MNFLWFSLCENVLLIIVFCKNDNEWIRMHESNNGWELDRMCDNDNIYVRLKVFILSNNLFS